MSDAPDTGHAVDPTAEALAARARVCAATEFGGDGPTGRITVDEHGAVMAYVDHAASSADANPAALAAEVRTALDIHGLAPIEASALAILAAGDAVALKSTPFAPIATAAALADRPTVVELAREQVRTEIDIAHVPGLDKVTGSLDEMPAAEVIAWLGQVVDRELDLWALGLNADGTAWDTPCPTGPALRLTYDQMAAVDQLAITPEVDIAIRCTLTGWVASLLTPTGRTEAVDGDIGEFLTVAAARWATPPS